MGRAMLSKSLIQFSIDGRGCVPSLLFDLRPNYGGGDEGDVDSLLPSGPLPCLLRPPPEFWTLTGKSGLVSCGGTCQQWTATGALCAADLGHTACGISPLGVSLSHQEASISLLSLSIRGQAE